MFIKVMSLENNFQYEFNDITSTLQYHTASPIVGTNFSVGLIYLEGANITFPGTIHQIKFHAVMTWAISNDKTSIGFTPVK